MEEVGLNIATFEGQSETGLLAGPLPQRIVTTDFGAVPLMVLCPFVYLLTDAHVEDLRLQPTEVASAHWIPVSALLDPAARTFEAAEVVDRLASRWGKVTRTLLGWSLGQVLYAAVRLRPSESLFSAEERKIITSHGDDRSLVKRIKAAISEDISSALAKWGFIGADPDPSRRLLLWGLTHGITCDFLGLLPIAKGLEWWRWPTLSRSDVRLTIWLFSYRFRKMKTQAAQSGQMEDRGPHVIIGEGLGVRSRSNSADEVEARPKPATIYSAAGFLLDGYFEQIQRAVYIILAARLLFGSAAALLIYRRYRQ